MGPVATLLAASLGLAAGWWCARLAWRWPRGEPMLGRVRCASCGARPPLRDAVPLASWLALRGRCRGCGTRTPRVLPAIEAACPAAAVAGLALGGGGWRGAACAVLLVALVPAVAVDLGHRLIPDAVSVPAALCGGVLAALASPGRWWMPAAAGAATGGGLLALALARPGGLGMGDVKLGAAIGAVLGPSVIPALLVAFAAGGAAGAAAALARTGAVRGASVPFAPFLAAGTVAGLAWGPALIGWYSAGIGGVP